MKIVLCSQGFTKEYVQRIKLQIPSQIHVVMTTLPHDYAEKGIQYIAAIFGSRTNQGRQNVKIKLLHGANQSFIMPISQLTTFFTDTLIQQRVSSHEHGSSLLVLPQEVQPQEQLPLEQQMFQSQDSHM
jgi:hypothetical protein